MQQRSKTDPGVTYVQFGRAWKVQRNGLFYGYVFRASVGWALRTRAVKRFPPVHDRLFKTRDEAAHYLIHTATAPNQES